MTFTTVVITAFITFYTVEIIVLMTFIVVVIIVLITFLLDVMTVSLAFITVEVMLCVAVNAVDSIVFYVWTTSHRYDSIAFLTLAITSSILPRSHAALAVKHCHSSYNNSTACAGRSFIGPQTSS